MRSITPHKKVLFVISDPGAAKAVLAYAFQIKGKGVNEIKIISDREHSFVGEFGLDVHVCTSKEIISVLDSYKPDYVFTGTSYSSAFEASFVRRAKQLSITSYSFIDHWTSFLDRFSHFGEPEYPNYVLVVDKRAAELAREFGIPADCIHVFGNPYYNFLRGWEPGISKHDYLEGLGLSSFSGNVVTFLPDSVTSNNCLLDVGINEYDAMSVLFAALSVADLENSVLVIRAHPNQDEDVMKEKAQRLNRAFNVDYQFTNQDVNTVMSYSNLIIGMFSNALIEATILGKPVIRILNGIKIADPLEGMNIGIPVFNEPELVQQIKLKI